tara:strand:- start:366 stop:947 length:582 start_codon:yes stop_codon:yes gene_type:complete
MKYFVLLIYLLCNYGCSQSTSIDAVEKDIISDIIDRNAHGYPPPPPIDNKNFIISQQVLDSLDNVRYTVAIYPLMEDEIHESSNKKLKASVYYDIIISEKLAAKEIENLDGIVSEVGHTVMLADTSNLKGPAAFTKFDILLNFSRIKFNKDATRAVFELGVSRGKLNSTAAIYCLKKENDKWYVDFIVPTTIS